MASGIFTVLDDIAVLMDDVAIAAKVATKKTAGILGDDLAVNAEKATGFVSSREIPVLWEITKGSLVNKVIIVPIVLLLNYFLPKAIIVILILGGLYLAYEGAEKIIDYLFHKKNESTASKIETNSSSNEKTKIKSAITTDFILSIEIVIIALGAVLTQPLAIQIGAVVSVALIATFGVYGIVAIIVRMDDVGYKLIENNNNKGILAGFGKLLVNLLPLVIRALSIIGTIALLLVAGGIFNHNISFFHNLLPALPALIKDFGVGLVVGLITVALSLILKAIFKK